MMTYMYILRELLLSLVETGPEIMEMSYVNVFSIRYVNIISPWKRHDPSLEQTRIPFTRGFVKNGPVVL